jgi:2-polyprenyl-3-methyl-5-hydroxy-6-metoxy-1,4-benzoquinol methylase
MARGSVVRDLASGGRPRGRWEDLQHGRRGGREPQYEVFADEFLDHAEGGFFNAYYDRPACLALLGDVTGKRVLDAACGLGLYAAELIRRGAQVTGFDHSPRMVDLPGAGRAG